MSEHSAIGKSKPTERTQVSISIPSGEAWQARFGLDLAMLTAYCGMNPIQGRSLLRLHICSARGSNLCKNRLDLVRLARRNGSSHMLWLDSDMEFPKDTLHRLMGHDVDIVAANCVVKKVPCTPTAIKRDGDRLYTDPDSVGLECVDKVGLAVALTRVDLFEKVSLPWFSFEWVEEVLDYSGEDIYFCKKLRNETDVSIMVDQDLSKEVRHTGAFSYDHSMVGTYAGKRFTMPELELKDATSGAAKANAG